MRLEDYILAHYSKRSLARYLQQINPFISYYGAYAERASYKDILAYIGLLRARGLHAKTVKNHLFALKIYFQYLLVSGKRKDHPCKKIHLKDQINRSILVESLYSKETLEQLYKNYESPKDKRAWAEKSESSKRRDKVILSLLIYQALTPREVIEMRVDDLDLEEGTVRIRGNINPRRRGNQERILALKSKQILLFNEYIKKYRKLLWKRQKPRKRQDYFVLNEHGLQLWPTYLNRMLSKGKKKHEVFTPMKIRQSVIAHLLKENHDIRIVQEFAGHRRAGSTEAYKRSGFEALKVSIERLHPRQ